MPEDTVSLLLRGACLVGIQEFRRGLADVNVVLMYDPCSRAYLVKGDALYHLGEFEHALVFYHRALARSCSNREEEAIRFGIGRAQMAVSNALGEKAAAHFKAMAGLIHK